LVPEDEKHLVFKEMHRVLKPGGRVAISDILAKKPLPEKLRANMALYVGCVSGASLVSQYEEYLRKAGFPAESVLIKHDGADLNVYIETNPDGTRTIGGKGGNLCCNPSIQSAPAAPATNGSSSSCSGPKFKPDVAAASAAASASCCGGGNKTSQECAFDDKDLADLEGQDLNDWAGESMHFKLLPACPFLKSGLSANIEFKGHTKYMLSSPKCWLLGRGLLASGVEYW
jgi:SAM-dependent methyltransferase